MRRVLPQRRAAETFDLRFWNQPFTVTVGFYADGTPGEVFIDSCKTGNDIESIARDAARGDSASPSSTASPSRPSGHAITRNSTGAAGFDPRRDCRRHCKDISEGRPMNFCATTTLGGGGWRWCTGVQQKTSSPLMPLLEAAIAEELGRAVRS